MIDDYLIVRAYKQLFEKVKLGNKGELKMPKYKIEGIHKHYENLQVKIDGEWYFMSWPKLVEILSKHPVEGKIVKARTRTWFE